jgi:hypothetical protein
MPRQPPAGLTISDHGYRTAGMNAASMFARLTGRYLAPALSISPILKIGPIPTAGTPESTLGPAPGIERHPLPRARTLRTLLGYPCHVERRRAPEARPHHHRARTLSPDYASGSVAFAILPTMFPRSNEPPVTASSSSSRRVSMSRSMSDPCRGSVVPIALLLDGPAPYWRGDAYRRGGSHGSQTVTALTFHAHRDHDRRRQQRHHVTRITVAARALRQCGRTSDGWSALAWMEKDHERHQRHQRQLKARSPRTHQYRIGCGERRSA